MKKTEPIGKASTLRSSAPVATIPSIIGPWDPDTRADSLDPYQASDIGLAEWGVEHAWRPNGDNRCWEHPYRKVAGMSWSGYALASRVLGITEWWNHPAFFAYVDRYMSVMAGQDERTHNQFQEDMWETWRASSSATPSRPADFPQANPKIANPAQRLACGFHRVKREVIRLPVVCRHQYPSDC